jgi:hypothetical protein
VPILQSSFSLLIFKLTFNVCSLWVCLLWVIRSFQFLSLTSLPPALPNLSTVFSTYPYILYLLNLFYAILLMLYHSLFFSLFPQVPQSNSTVTNMFCF